MDAHSALQADPNIDNLFAYIANTDLSGREILALTGELSASIPQVPPTIFDLPASDTLQADIPTSVAIGPVFPIVTKPLPQSISATRPLPTLRTPTKRKRHTLVNPGNPLDPRTRICQPPGSPRTEKRRCENARAVRRWRVRKAAKDAGVEMERQVINSLRAERGGVEGYQPFFPLQLHSAEQNVTGHPYSAE